MDDITKGEELQKKLQNIKKNGWKTLKEGEEEAIYKFSDEYIYFLNNCKTEREVIGFSRSVLEKNNFRSINEMSELKQGDRVFYINRDKSMYIAVIGKERLENGINIIGAHVDSPRLDLKPNP